MKAPESEAIVAKKGAATAVKEQVEAVFKAASGELLADGLKKLFGAVITTGGGTATPAVTPTPGASTAAAFDVKAEALRALAQEPEAVNAFCQDRADQAQRAIDALNSHINKGRR